VDLTDGTVSGSTTVPTWLDNLKSSGAIVSLVTHLGYFYSRPSNHACSLPRMCSLLKLSVSTSIPRAALILMMLMESSPLVAPTPPNSKALSPTSPPPRDHPTASEHRMSRDNEASIPVLEG
jgi:hypothetical protein